MRKVVVKLALYAALSLLGGCGSTGGIPSGIVYPRFGDPGTALELSPPFPCQTRPFEFEGTYNGVRYVYGCYCLVFTTYTPMPNNYYGPWTVTQMTVGSWSYGGLWW